MLFDGKKHHNKYNKGSKLVERVLGRFFARESVKLQGKLQISHYNYENHLLQISHYNYENHLLPLVLGPT